MGFSSNTKIFFSIFFTVYSRIGHKLINKNAIVLSDEFMNLINHIYLILLNAGIFSITGYLLLKLYFD